MKRFGVRLALVLLIIPVCIDADRRGSTRSRSPISHKNPQSPRNIPSSSSSETNWRREFTIGVGVYAGKKLLKLAAKFAGGDYNFEFAEYDSWRQKDGLLCRNYTDCTWIDRRMHCRKHTFQFDISTEWFNGNYTDVIGQCTCSSFQQFDEENLVCETPRVHQAPSEESTGGSYWWLIAVFAAAISLGCTVYKCSKKGTKAEALEEPVSFSQQQGQHENDLTSQKQGQENNVISSQK